MKVGLGKELSVRLALFEASAMRAISRFFSAISRSSLA